MMRLDAGRVNLKCDWESVEDLVGNTLARLEASLRGRQVSVNIPNTLPVVYVDGALVSQLLFNLLDNCIKHTPAGTPIMISAGLEGDRVRVVVEDAGPGLPPGDPERLFAKFQRGRDEGNTGGAGLGLAICRAIADAHGGSIHAIAREVGGAKFVFTLPVSDRST